MTINEELIRELLRVRDSDSRLVHREGQKLEFKEQFNFAGRAEYFRDFAAFANNRGGHIIFGVKDSPRIPVGLSGRSLERFNKIDPEQITGFLLDIFSSDIRWEQDVVSVMGKSFGVYRIYEAETKPVIAKKNEGKGQVIKNGEVYYRYKARTQKIQYAELENIISKRIDKTVNRLQKLMERISRIGPENALVVDSEKALIEKDDAQILVLEETLANQLNFIKEGQFSEKKGATTYQLVGDVGSADNVQVIKKVKENLTETYPYSARELANKVKEHLPDVGPNKIWKVIHENSIKNNPAYSAYNFRNKMHQEQFKKDGKLPTSTPSIYNEKAVDLIVKLLKR